MGPFTHLENLRKSEIYNEMLQMSFCSSPHDILWTWTFQGGFVVVLAVLLVLRNKSAREYRRQLERQKHVRQRMRARTDSLGHHSSIRRFFDRSSLDISRNASTLDNTAPQDDTLEDAEIAKLEEHENELFSAQAAKRFAHKGPVVQSLVYKTMSPPPSWSETSRRLLPSKDIQWHLHQRITLTISRNSTISLCSGRQQETNHLDRSPETAASKQNQILSVQDVSVHVKNPVEGGTLELFVKTSTTHPWREHTFRSASAAAQFQLDLLALQFLGTAIHNMYEALALVHRGSIACISPETVLHDRACNPDVELPEGVAWDDVMRCLGTNFPSMKTRLDAIWWVRSLGTTAGRRVNGTRKAQNGDTGIRRQTGEGAEGTDGMTPEYVDKRLMLGIVDFFRLFVPLLPDISVAQTSCSRLRLEQMLRWRKRVARAAILVRSYVKARTVVNKGWNLEHPLQALPGGYLKRRLAFDDNLDNVRHDLAARNEYYEATVSRDVLFHTRSRDSLENGSLWNSSGDPVPVKGYQAYSLVGVHSFPWVADLAEFPLRPEKDPVQAIPSLRTLVAANPDVHFFVHGFFAEGQRSTATVQVFVRSLPQGVDESFDRNMERFVSGDAVVRNEKLECVIQLGIERAGLSVVTKLMLGFLSFLLRITSSSRNRPTAQPLSRSDTRTSLPPVNCSECGVVYHFGGTLQQDASMPLNYVSFTTHASSRQRNTLATRMLMSYFESGGVSKDVVDFSYILGASQLDELPERALGTVRVANTNIISCRLPMEFVSKDARMHQRVSTCRKNPANDMYLLSRIFVFDPILTAVASAVLSISDIFGYNRGGNNVENEPFLSRDTYERDGGSMVSTSLLVSNDVVDLAVNQLIESLRGVEVPVRGGYLAAKKGSFASSDLLVPSSSTTSIVSVPVLHVLSRDDIARYVIASDGSLKMAAVRVLQSATWRGLTFPIEKKACRIELQSGQFFQQGRDLSGNPVLYFRNFCLARWRRNEEASIAAILLRLECALDELVKDDPLVRFTVVVMMGKPDWCKQETGEGNAEVSQELEAPTPTRSQDGRTHNPRLQYPGEKLHAHSSKRELLTLIDILEKHYPERLNAALVVVGYGNRTYMKSILTAKLAMSVTIRSKRTRDKVRFMTNYKELQRYIDKSELIDLAGGCCRVTQKAFESQVLWNP